MSHIKLPDKNARRPFIQKVKDTMLIGYVILTLLGAYSAAIFYAGTQFAGVHASDNVTNLHNQPSKK